MLQIGGRHRAEFQPPWLAGSPLPFQSVLDGALLCAPAGWMGKPHIEKYREQDFQLTFSASPKGDLPPIPREPTKLYKLNGGIGQQGWREDKIAPVLWTDWPCQEGVVLRQEVFTIIDGARDVETGIEPLYAWVRLSVSHVDPLRAPKTFSFGVQLSKVFYDNNSAIDDSVFFLVRPDKCSMGKGVLTANALAVPASGKGEEGLRFNLQTVRPNDGIAWWRRKAVVQGDERDERNLPSHSGVAGQSRCCHGFARADDAFCSRRAEPAGERRL